MRLKQNTLRKRLATRYCKKCHIYYFGSFKQGCPVCEMKGILDKYIQWREKNDK